ncbi:MAG: VCBS repeat-containing protein, partial [Tannerella sp.]|nr:VCBS repeat-containing protein [Tannerella sp.]
MNTSLAARCSMSVREKVTQERGARDFTFPPFSCVMRSSLIMKLLILLFFFPAGGSNLCAQGIDDLGVVWNKTFGQGIITNIKPNPDGTYTACGYPWLTITDPGRMDGMIIIFDESGNELRRATATIPQSYISTHTTTRANAQFNAAFQTGDGGYIAFGRLYNWDAPNSEKQPNWDANSNGSQFLTYGAWIVKFDADLNVVLDTLVRGMGFYNGHRTSDGNIVMAGFDATMKGINGGAGDSITMLRKYDQNGVLLVDKQDKYREIRSISKYAGDAFIAVTPDRLIRIDASLNMSVFLLTGLPGIPANFSLSNVSPSLDGGAFLSGSRTIANQPYQSYVNGYYLYKYDSGNNFVYSHATQPQPPNSSALFYSAPLLLPGSDVPPKYVGTATRYTDDGNQNVALDARLIYELTDGPPLFTFRTGDPYPDGTSLIAVSQSDGFFSCGRTAAGQATVAKLSTCANFKLHAGATEETMVASGTITLPGRTIGYTGYKGTVTGGWTLTDITPSGQATTLAGTVSGSGFTIPAQSLSLLPGKAFALLRYTVTATDEYLTGIIPQTCQQTQNILVRVYFYPDNVVETDCAVPMDEMVWTINTTPVMLGNNDVSVYQTPYVGDLDGDGHVEIVAAKSYAAGGGHNHSTSWCYASNGIFVFDMKDNTSVLINLPATTMPGVPENVYHSTTGRGQIGLARSNASSPGLIVVAAMDGYLYAYDKNGNTKWGATAATNRSDNPYTTYNVANDGSGNGYKSASVMFSDFNGDGHAEIVTGDRIFDLATGKLLLNCGFLNGQNQNTPKVSVVDVNGDGRSELVWGGNVYSINITDRTGATGNNTFTPATPVTDPTLLPILQVLLPNTSVTATIPADFDLDGQVDILAYGSAYFYVYDPLTGDIKVMQEILSADRGSGTPFVGNIDDDKYPEIMYGE